MYALKTMSTRSLFTAALIGALASTACSSPTYVRGAEVEGFDDATMGTTLDKRDLEQLLHENLKSFVESGVAKRWVQEGQRPILATYPMANETSEHIGSQLDALMSEVETYMVNTNIVRVVSVERQRQMIAEIEQQHGGGFDPAHIAEYNKQLGAQYYMTGKVFSSDQRAEGERRVQYFMFMQVIDVATSEIVWQNKSAVTKGIANL
jgi:penicillin-binding protein activator